MRDEGGLAKESESGFQGQGRVLKMAKTAERTTRIAPGVLLFALALFAVLTSGCSSWETFRERNIDLRHKLFDNSWEDPEVEQRMARAEQFYIDRNYEMAIKEFKNVADNQGNNVDMRERARFLQAECRRFLYEYPDAVDTYHKLLIDFPTGAHRPDAVARMYEMADYWLEDFRNEIARRANEKGILRWQPSWPNPSDKTRPWIDQEGRALEAMENIKTQAMTSPLADKALFWCGYVNFVRGNFQQADRFFSELVELHRNSPLRPTALAYAIQAKNNATGGAVYDGRKCAEALQLVHVAEATVPELTQDPAMADKLTRAKFAIRSQQAEKDFRTAEYYERTGHPGSAVFMYELVRRRFPGTRYADIALERKDSLLALLNEGHPSVGNDPFAIVGAKVKDVVGKKPASADNPSPGQTNPNAGVFPAGGFPQGVVPGGGTPMGVVPGVGISPGVSPGVGMPQGVIQGGGMPPRSSLPPAALPSGPVSPGVTQGAPVPPGNAPGGPIAPGPGWSVPSGNAPPGPLSPGVGPMAPMAPMASGIVPGGPAPQSISAAPSVTSSASWGPQGGIMPSGGATTGTVPQGVWTASSGVPLPVVGTAPGISQGNSYSQPKP